VNLGDENQLDWMPEKGVDRRKFPRSGILGAEQDQARVQLTQAFEVTGVPTLVVDGKYTTSVSMAGSPEGLMKTLDELIAKARAERPKKK
jgi:thiol:disulfide interchange protein DsbA